MELRLLLIKDDADCGLLLISDSMGKEHLPRCYRLAVKLY